MMDIEPRLLRYFFMVTEELHFGRAAAKLYVSQPALSESIKRLESTLGVELLVRTNRRVELTPAGRVLQVQAPEILRQIEHAAAAVLAIAHDEAHRFRVGYSPFLDLNRICEIRSRFQSEQSGWSVEFISAKTVELTNLLLNGRISVALLIGPVAEKLIESEVVFEEPFIIGLPTDHPLTVKDSIRFKDLANEKVIWLPRSFHPAFYDRFVAACEVLGYTPKFTFEVTTLPECLHLIHEHRGITFTTKSAQSLAHPGVVFRPLKELITVETVVAFQSNVDPSILARFVDLATEIFAVHKEGSND